MPETPSTEVAAFLADARKRWEVFGEADAFPALVAAVEAVLAKADEWARFGAPGDAQSECAEDVREAIAAELLKGATGG